MKKLWNQNNEAKALIVSVILTIIGFMGTAFLFWLHCYDIPLAVLIGGAISSLSWLFLYLLKKSEKKGSKLEIVVMFSRLTLVVLLAITFTVLDKFAGIVTVSPIYLIVAYFVASMASLVFYVRKGE